MTRASAARRSVLLLLLLGLGAGSPVQGQDPFVVADLAARAAAEAPAGKKYGEVVGQAFGKEHGATIQRCAKETKRPDLSDFELLLRMDGTGAVDQALAKPGTNLATCVRNRMVGWKTLVPPQPEFWIKVAVKLQKK